MNKNYNYIDWDRADEVETDDPFWQQLKHERRMQSLREYVARFRSDVPDYEDTQHENNND